MNLEDFVDWLNGEPGAYEHVREWACAYIDRSTHEQLVKPNRTLEYALKVGEDSRG